MGRGREGKAKERKYLYLYYNLRMFLYVSHESVADNVLPGYTRVGWLYMGGPSPRDRLDES